MPLLYGAIYLWSELGPVRSARPTAGRCRRLRRLVTVEGKKVSGGADLVEQLTKDTSSFTWVVTDAATAADGVADGSFAFSITVPKDFSADLTSIA
ncbi:MAG: hypothetical protein R2742_04390 [Micropruina glycogenica]